MNNKVTILTCVYLDFDGLSFLREAINSTLNQTYKNFEYLIIDDASPNKKVIQCIESFKDSRIRFIKNKKNIGLSKTSNMALKLIKTPYVIRLDQDDVNLPNRVKDQIHFLENNHDIDIVCSWEHTINSEGVIIRDWKRKINNYGEFLGYVLVGLCPIWHPSIAYKTKSMIEVGGFNEKYAIAEDFELTARLAFKRYNASVVPKFHLLQREHKNRQSVQYLEKQTNIGRRVHDELIKKICSHPDIDLLCSFLRLEKNSKNLIISNKYINKIDIILNYFISCLEKSHQLTTQELASVKKIIFYRVGFGIKYASLITKFPNFLFIIIYFMLSPLQLSFLRKIVSRIYHKYMFLRSFLSKKIY